MGLKKLTTLFIFLSSGLFNVGVNAAQDLSLQRVHAIAEYTIKMQILDEPNPQQITQKLAQLMVGNTKNYMEIQKFIDLIPVEGIANYLRQMNLQGLSKIETKQMKPVLETEIQQISSMFRSCKIHPNIQKTQTHYLVEISCSIPKPSLAEKNAFQQKLQRFKAQSVSLQKIHYLNEKQKIFAKSQYDDFKTILLIEIKDHGILRSVIENDVYFPNIVIDQRDQVLELSTSAPN